MKKISIILILLTVLFKLNLAAEVLYPYSRGEAVGEDCACEKYRLLCVPDRNMRPGVEGVGTNEAYPLKDRCAVLLRQSTCTILGIHSDLVGSDRVPDCSEYLPHNFTAFRACLALVHEIEHTKDPDCEVIIGCAEEDPIEINIAGMVDAIKIYCPVEKQSINCRESCAAFRYYWRYKKASACNCKYNKEDIDNPNRKTECLRECLLLDYPDDIIQLCKFPTDHIDEEEKRNCQNLIGIGIAEAPIPEGDAPVPEAEDDNIEAPLSKAPF